MTHLRKRVRAENGRDPEPSAVIIESQAIKTVPARGSERGFAGGNKIDGRKRQDSLTHWNCFWQSRPTAWTSLTTREPGYCLERFPDPFPAISPLFADQGYPGPLLDWIAEQWTTEIIPGISRIVLHDGKARLVHQPEKAFRFRPNNGPLNARWPGSPAFAGFARR